MTEHRFTAYVIEDKIVIKDMEGGVFTTFVQMKESVEFNTKAWAEWITFCLNYWEAHYKNVKVGLQDEWSQVKVINEIQPD